MHLIAAEFESKGGVPGIVGALDGCHFQVDAYGINEQDYINRKFYHSINVAGICLPNKLFSYVCVGFPGSVHDARVFRLSDLYRKIQNNPEELFVNPSYHIICDSAYASETYVVPLYKASLANTAEKRLFNRKASKSRVVIEHSFGDLKGTWRRTLHVKGKIERCIRIIVTAFVLHNFLIMNNERSFTSERTTTPNSPVTSVTYQLNDSVPKRQHLVRLITENT